MHRPAGQRRQPDVTGHQDRLRRGRDARQAEPRGERALGGGAAGGKRGFLGMLHDAAAEAAGVGQRDAHQARRADGAPAVGEGDRARLGSSPSSASSSPRQPVVTAP